MKIIKKILTYLAQNKFAWFFIKPFAKIGNFLYNSNSHKAVKPLDSNIISSLFINLTVQNGPFKGMRYPEINSVGSSIYPKLLGTYEKELWETIEDLKKNKYTEIIDVGCAEGYYAVGTAITTQGAKIYAYDIDMEARILCEKMAKLNNVKEKVIIREKFTPEELGSFPFTGKSLIICDCEGYEKELFNNNNIHNLINCALIIETHDLIDIEISTYLKNVFDKTHDIYLIKSTDDIEKALTYKIKGLEKFTLEDKKKILAENRQSIMEWMICKPKNNQ